MEKRCKGVIHQIKKGDTLYRLSKMYGVRLIDIMKENPYVNVYNLQIGEEICIPTEIYQEEERILEKILVACADDFAAEGGCLIINPRLLMED